MRLLLPFAAAIALSAGTPPVADRRTVRAPPPAACATVPAGQRVACGILADNATTCGARGCCLDPSTHPYCYMPTHAAAPLKTIHVVQGEHLDIGFADTAVNIINLWWHEHFPLAGVVGRNLTQRGGDEALKFTVQAYMVNLFLNCDPGILPGLVCPDAAQLADFNASVQAGYLTWHAYPHSANHETQSAEAFAFALRRTHDLDAQFGVPRKAVLSLRDVPGLTRAVLPLLAAAGGLAVSVGANPDSNPPLVPRAFRWLDAASGTELLGLLHPFGYGSGDPSDIVQVPGCPDAVYVEWRGDNTGPPPVEEVLALWAALRAAYPGARVVASTFDEAVAALAPYAAQLPLLEDELGSTWDNAALGDARRALWYKQAQVLLGRCLAAGACDYADARVYAFATLLLKNAEHTYSIDASKYLRDWSNYTNAYLRQRLAPPADPAFALMVASWVEQRALAVDAPLRALGGHPLAAQLRAAWAAAAPAAPPDPAAAGFAPFVPGARFAAGRFTVAFDAATGALSALEDAATGEAWASGSRLLGLPFYQTYSAGDWAAVVAQYCNWAVSPCPLWWQQNHAYAGINASDPVHAELPAVLDALWLRSDAAAGVATFLARAHFSAAAHADYGAPAELWTRFDVPLGHPPLGPGPTGGRINVTLSIFNKTASHMSDSLFLRWLPAPDGGGAPWHASKLGSWVDAAAVHAGGNQVHHGIDERGLRYGPTAAGGRTLTVLSDTAPLAAMGVPWGMPVPMGTPPDTGAHGAAFFLAGQTWNTNSPLWYPFLDGEANTAWTAALEFA